MMHLRVAAAALAALLAVACASQAPMADLPGAPPRKPSGEIRRDPNADQALAQVEAKAQGQPKAKQVEVYLSFRKAYPATTAGEEALYRAGVLSFELGDYVNARKQFNELLFENPLFPQAQDARFKLGLSALELKSYRDAYQTLLPLRDRVPSGQRAQLEDALRRAAEGARLYDQAMKMALQRAEQASTPEERNTALAQIADLVDAQVGVEEVGRVQADLSPSHPAWPLLTFKLARVYQHTRDIPKLKSTLQSLLSNAPGSPYTAEAQEMLARADRVGQVRARTLGVLLPLTGKYKGFGEAVMRGIRLALKGSDVELVVKDTQGDGTRAATAVEELVFNDGAVAAIGPLFIEDSKRAALVAQDLGLPLLTLTRSEDVTDIGPFVFRNMLTYSAQTKGLVDWATKVMGYKSFAVLYPNTPYGVEMTNDFWDQVLAQGGAVRGAESYTADQTTFTTQAKKLVGRFYLEDRRDYFEDVQEATKDVKDSYRRRKAVEKAKSKLDPIVDFEALFIPDEWQRVGLVAPALAVEDIITNTCDAREIENLKKTTGKRDIRTVTLLGGNGWNSPKNSDGIPQLVERGGKFVLCSVFVDGFYADSSREPTKRFVRLYSEAYKDSTPTLLDAIGYDSARMLRQLLDKQTAALDRAAVRDGLNGIKDFEGATGKTRFNDRREAEKPLFFLTIDQKGIREIQPTDRISGS
ncbi:MAG TPA: penicillin-binding protein activator [Myxococcaceae bacterium]|nr:penicillin-binding protein activator [Myxococcaceae bacterium]